MHVYSELSRNNFEIINQFLTTSLYLLQYAAAGLDLVELRAVYASLPLHGFQNDPSGQKAKFKDTVRDRLRELTTSISSSSSSGAGDGGGEGGGGSGVTSSSSQSLRHPVYSSVKGLCADKGGYFDPESGFVAMEVAAGEDFGNVEEDWIAMKKRTAVDVTAAETKEEQAAGVNGEQCSNTVGEGGALQAKQLEDEKEEENEQEEEEEERAACAPMSPPPSLLAALDGTAGGMGTTADAVAGNRRHDERWATTDIAATPTPTALDLTAASSPASFLKRRPLQPQNQGSKDQGVQGAVVFSTVAKSLPSLASKKLVTHDREEKGLSSLEQQMAPPSTAADGGGGGSSKKEASKLLLPRWSPNQSPSLGDDGLQQSATVKERRLLYSSASTKPPPVASDLFSLDNDDPFALAKRLPIAPAAHLSPQSTFASTRVKPKGEKQIHGNQLLPAGSAQNKRVNRWPPSQDSPRTDSLNHHILAVTTERLPASHQPTLIDPFGAVSTSISKLDKEIAAFRASPPETNPAKKSVMSRWNPNAASASPHSPVFSEAPQPRVQQSPVARSGVVVAKEPLRVATSSQPTTLRKTGLDWWSSSPPVVTLSPSSTPAAASLRPHGVMVEKVLRNNISRPVSASQSAPRSSKVKNEGKNFLQAQQGKPRETRIKKESRWQRVSFSRAYSSPSKIVDLQATEAVNKAMPQPDEAPPPKADRDGRAVAKTPLLHNARSLDDSKKKEVDTHVKRAPVLFLSENDSHSSFNTPKSTKEPERALMTNLSATSRSPIFDLANDFLNRLDDSSDFIGTLPTPPSSLKESGPIAKDKVGLSQVDKVSSSPGKTVIDALGSIEGLFNKFDSE